MMAAMHGAEVPRRTARAGAPATLLAVMLMLSACGGSDGGPKAEAATTTTTAATTTPAPTTTTSTTAPTTTSTTTSSTSTSTSTSTTTSTTTTSTTTTLAKQLSQPIAPPTDDADEPLIELGRLLIPAIGVDMAMYEGIRMSTLDKGPGHWPGSALPGQIGNLVVGGHRTSKHKVFRNIDDLVAGDQIIFQDATGEYVYLVNRVEVVQPTDVWIINPTDTPTATLFACHPPGSTRQRIVVFADLQT
jgi:sortase A